MLRSNLPFAFYTVILKCQKEDASVIQMHSDTVVVDLLQSV